MSTYPNIGIARIGHSGDIHDCRCGFVRLDFSDWDLKSVAQTSKAGKYTGKKGSYTPKTGNYTNSPNRLS